MIVQNDVKIQGNLDFFVHFFKKFYLTNKNRYDIMAGAFSFGRACVFVSIGILDKFAAKFLCMIKSSFS